KTGSFFGGFRQRSEYQSRSDEGKDQPPSEGHRQQLQHGSNQAAHGRAADEVDGLLQDGETQDSRGGQRQGESVLLLLSVSSFLSLTGTLPPSQQREEEAAVVESVVAKDHANLPKSVKKTTRKKGGAKSSFEDENTPSTTRKGRAAKKPPSTSKRAKALTVSKQSTTIRRSSRKPLVTPARSMLDSSLLMGATPLITPRFDPRLPQTPAVRVPRHKERVYSISVNGSPIAAGNEDIVINVPIGNGESIQLLASQMDSVDLSLLDDTALRSIRLLQNRLTNLCGTAP
uniref:Cell division cycle associated 8 n=1 Tax=Oryzias latipes TaxID=8090 RepID=A0A3P9MFK8_ORYLA